MVLREAEGCLNRPWRHGQRTKHNTRRSGCCSDRLAGRSALQQGTQRVLQSLGAGRIVRSSQHAGNVFVPSFLRTRIVAARQQLQLQRAARIELISRRGHLGCHFQAQQRLGLATLGGTLAQRSHPGIALAAADATAQLGSDRNRIGLALFPS